MLRNGTEFVIHGISVNGPGVTGNRRIVQDVDAIASLWKFNLIRVGCGIRPRLGVKEINDLDEIVSAFTTRNVVVLIDPRDHFSGYYQDPAAPPGTPSLADLKNWYKGIAARYRSNPLVWYEVMSGPGRRDERRDAEIRRDMQIWHDTHESVIETIRRDAGANNVIVCDGRNQGTESGSNGALPVVENASALLTFGPALSRKHPNLLYAFHVDETWNAGAPKLGQFLDKVQALGLPVFVSEYGNSKWADSTPAIEAMLDLCKQRRIGRCAWNWSPADNHRLCAPDDKGGGWQIDTADGSRPTNLSWLGDKVWDDNHSRVSLHGVLIDRTAWTASAFAAPSDPNNPSLPDAVFSGYTIDEDYWTSRKPQEPGQWFQIDMGSKRTFSRLMVDTRARYADYPRGYELYTSNDGVKWGAPIAQGTNDQSVLRLTFPVQNARYIKIVQTGKTWHHWVIANIEVYAPIGTVKPGLPSNATGKETVLEPRAWGVTAGPNRWYQPEIPLRARRDDNQSTATGQAQQPGHFYQVDMSEPQRFNKIVINTGRNLSDYPRGYEVSVSNDGVEWSKPIAVGRGAPITTITFPTQTARYVKVTLTRRARNYWTLTEFRVYLQNNQ